MVLPRGTGTIGCLVSAYAKAREEEKEAMTELERAVNGALSIKVNDMRILALRSNRNVTRTFDLYEISMKAVELMAGQGGYDELTKQFEWPEFDQWEMRKAIVQLATKWGGSVLGEILTITTPPPTRSNEIL